jgi:hypothetical protein
MTAGTAVRARAPAHPGLGVVQRWGTTWLVHEDETLNAVYAARIGASATVWTAPGSHTAALDAAAGEYERRVVAFLDGALLARD